MNKPFQHSAGAYMLSYSKGEWNPCLLQSLSKPSFPSYHKKGMLPRLQGTIKLKALSRLFWQNASFARTFSPSRETRLQAHLCYPINPSCSRENIFFYKRDCFHLPNFSFWVAYSFQNSKDILLNIFSGTYVEHFRISFKLEYLPGLCHGVAKSWTWLSNYHFDFSLFLYHEKQATETSFYSLI